MARRSYPRPSSPLISKKVGDRVLDHPLRYVLWLGGFIALVVLLGIGYRLFMGDTDSAELPLIKGCEGPIRIRVPQAVPDTPAKQVYKGWSTSKETSRTSPVESLLPPPEEPMGLAPPQQDTVTPETPSLEEPKQPSRIVPPTQETEEGAKIPMKTVPSKGSSKTTRSPSDQQTHSNVVKSVDQLLEQIEGSSSYPRANRSSRSFSSQP